MNLYQYDKEALELISNRDLILKKNQILDSLKSQLALLGNRTVENYPTLNKLSPPPKVSQGEKQAGLPFLILDYPRCFSPENIFAIRTLVWWGKFVSCSLHLKGQFLRDSAPYILIKKKGLFPETYLANEGDEWEHDLDSKPYQLIEELKEEDLLEVPYLKLAFKLPLEQLNQLDEFYEKCFNELIKFTPYGKD